MPFKFLWMVICLQSSSQSFSLSIFFSWVWLLFGPSLLFCSLPSRSFGQPHLVFWLSSLLTWVLSSLWIVNLSPVGQSSIGPSLLALLVAFFSLLLWSSILSCSSSFLVVLLSILRWVFVFWLCSGWAAVLFGRSSFGPSFLANHSFSFSWLLHSYLVFSPSLLNPSPLYSFNLSPLFSLGDPFCFVACCLLFMFLSSSSSLVL